MLWRWSERHVQYFRDAEQDPESRALGRVPVPAGPVGRLPVPHPAIFTGQKEGSGPPEAAAEDTWTPAPPALHPCPEACPHPGLSRLLGARPCLRAASHSLQCGLEPRACADPWGQVRAVPWVPASPPLAGQEDRGRGSPLLPHLARSRLWFPVKH